MDGQSREIVPMPPSPRIELTFADIKQLAVSMATSNLFGIKTADEALALMMVAQAEGRHPALAARAYHIVDGRPTKKAEVMLRDFIDAGGAVEWHELSDQVADATFKHRQGGSIRIAWDMRRVEQAKIRNKDMYLKYPRQMLRSRCISEGVRTVYPGATSGFYDPDEITTTIDHEPPPREADFIPDKMDPTTDAATWIGQVERDLLDAGSDHLKIKLVGLAADDAKSDADVRAIWDLPVVKKLRETPDGNTQILAHLGRARKRVAESNKEQTQPNSEQDQNESDESDAFGPAPVYDKNGNEVYVVLEAVDLMRHIDEMWKRYDDTDRALLLAKNEYWIDQALRFPEAAEIINRLKLDAEPAPGESTVVHPSPDPDQVWVDGKITELARVSERKTPDERLKAYQDIVKDGAFQAESNRLKRQNKKEFSRLSDAATAVWNTVKPATETEA